MEDTTKYIFTIEDIIQLKLKEIWLLDKDYKVLDMRIIGMLPIAMCKNKEENKTKTKELCWLAFNEMRFVLVRYDITLKDYSKDNFAWDVVHFTWDDIFIKRLFSASIIKNDNNNETFIKDYLTGKDISIKWNQIIGINKD